jgi:hypothetical protein
LAKKFRLIDLLTIVLEVGGAVDLFEIGATTKAEENTEIE